MLAWKKPICNGGTVSEEVRRQKEIYELYIEPVFFKLYAAIIILILFGIYNLYEYLS